MYEVVVYVYETDLCIVKLRSITQVAKFLETVNFSICNVDIFTPRNHRLRAEDILKVWRS